MQWYPLKNETPKAYQAFCVYLVMHKLKLAETAKVLNLKLFTIKTLMKEHGWEARKEAFLHYFLSNEAQEMHLRHIKKAIALQEKAVSKFDSIDPEQLSNSEVIRFLTAGANLERLARRAFEGSKNPDFTDDNDLEKVENFLED
ncbi:MAG: hypothetical protein WCF95_04220 [bacterium]